MNSMNIKLERKLGIVADDVFLQGQVAQAVALSTALARTRPWHEHGLGLENISRTRLLGLWSQEWASFSLGTRDFDHIIGWSVDTVHSLRAQRQRMSIESGFFLLEEKLCAKVIVDQTAEWVE